MALKCPACGYDNSDEALYCNLCQNVFRKQGSSAGEAPAEATAAAALPTAPPQTSIPYDGRGGDLGPLRFERQAPLFLRLLWSILSAGFTIFSLAALATGGINPAGPLVGLLLGAVMVFASVQAWVSVLRCYEFGVQHRGLRGTAALRYEDVGFFVWGATRQYTNGVYTSTNYVFEFRPRPGVAGRPIRFTTVLRGGDEALDGLRDSISRILAARLSEELQRTGQARWTPNMRFLKNGLEYRPSGLLGRGDPASLAWSQVQRWDIAEGVFKLWALGTDDPVMEEKVSEPNFFPGLYLLDGLRRR